MAIKHPLMRYHGAKFRLAPWIISFFPDHQTYIEPFGGAAGVLLQKSTSSSEIYNDLDGDIVNVFRVLQDKELTGELIRKLLVTPYSRSEFELSYEDTTDRVEKARRTLIRSHQGFGSAGATKNKTGFRKDSARKYGTAAHLWARYPGQIACFVDRLKDVIIENKPAIEIINDHDGPGSLFYVDPPYVHSTRIMRGSGCYTHEMNDDDHIELLDRLKELSGKAVVSGYKNEMYDDILSGWAKFSTASRISAGRGAGIRKETVWLNPACMEGQAQQSLFT